MTIWPYSLLRSLILLSATEWAGNVILEHDVSEVHCSGRLPLSFSTSLQTSKAPLGGVTYFVMANGKLEETSPHLTV